MFSSMLALMILAGLAIASLTMTISKSHIMEQPRGWASKLSPWLGSLLRCPYCLSHWIAFGVVWYSVGFFPVGQLILLTFVIVTIASLASLWISHLFLALDELDSEEME